VIIRTGADPHLTRAGDELAYGLHIRVADAALGTTAPVPALGGQAHVRVPPGTQPGDVLTVKGKGLPGSAGTAGAT
jgi:DnaJ-class molecular chaperone